MFVLLPILLKYMYDVIYNREYYNIYKDPYIYLSFGYTFFLYCRFHDNTIFKYLSK